MKKYLYIVLTLGVLFGTSCLSEKNYDCECTYVADSLGPAAGQPNKVENTTVKGRFREDAEIECSFEGKYITQGYSGTCLLK
ncbi:MAG: hypothetical protein R2831_05450 [Chitinophagaceae bacterium]